MLTGHTILRDNVSQWFFTAAAILLLLLSPGASADTATSTTLVVISANEGVYRDIVDLLQQSSGQQSRRYEIATPLKDSKLETSLGRATSIITVGTRAAEAVYRHKPAAPILSTLITQSGFSYLAGKYYTSIDSALEQGVSAIYLDQPLERLYHLGKLLLPDAKHIGVLTSDISSIDAVTQFSPDQDRGVTLEYVTVASDSRPINVLSPVIKNSDFVIALPGKKSITVSAAKWILTIGSQTRTPVIAYSKKYAISGAVAAVYTSPVNVADHIVQVINTTNALQLGPSRLYPPEGFSIEINGAVAGILGIPVASKEYYRKQIRKMEALE